MFTVVRSEYIRHSLEVASQRWWERHELPPLSLLRDGLLLLEQGGELSESQRALLLRAALSHGKGVRTALRHQTNPERTAILLNDALLTVNSHWTEEDLRSWLSTAPHVNQWRELLRTELQATNLVALPYQRRKIETFLDTINKTDQAHSHSGADRHDDEWDLFAEAAHLAATQATPSSAVRYLVALILLLLIAIFFYQRYAPILGQSDMVEVTAILAPPPELELATATPTDVAMLAAKIVGPIHPSDSDGPPQPESPLQPLSPLQPDSPLQPNSPLQNLSPLPTPTATATPTPENTATPTATPTATFTPAPTLPPVLIVKNPGEPEPLLRTVLIDQTEVTNAEYRKCVEANACPSPDRNSSATHSDYFVSPVFNDYPVINVDLVAAHAYCTYRRKRLPSAEEWETAASFAPATERHYHFPWGDQFIEQYVNSAESQHGDTTIVSNYRPHGSSPLGLDDMAGNVAEWTATVIQQDGLLKSVVKGGSYRDTETALLADSFQLVDVYQAEPWIGFRCVR